MAVLVLGINHRTAALEMRECLAFSPDTLPRALRDVLGTDGIQEVAIISTCNRTEVYCATNLEGEAALLEWLGGFHSVDAMDLAGCAYVYWNGDAVRHLMRVCCGLDSMVLGEPQILGQIKDAYTLAREAGTVGRELSRLFETSFSVAKRVRTETRIGENPVSVAFAAVSMARHIFSELGENSALLIGAGKTIRLVAQHLREAGVRNMVVANRTLETAEALAADVHGRAIHLSAIADVLAQADIIIASTGSQLPILGKGAVERAVRQRKHKPMFMVDLAVPRDIEPEVGQLDDVYLYTVDDLGQVVEQNVKSRTDAAQEAEILIEQGINEFLQQVRALDAVATLKQFRSQAESLRDQELDKAMKMLRNGGDAEAVLQSLARGLTNKLLHRPSVQLRQATADGRPEVGQWLRELYDLPSRQEARRELRQAGDNSEAGAAEQNRFHHHNTSS